MAAAASLPLPALDIVISFDVTGSMMPVLASVRENLERLTATIFAGAGSDVRMQVFAHGDYDSEPYQVMSTEGFTRDPEQVAGFIRSVQPVFNSWNEGEAYELVLERCKALDYRPEAKKLLILVGDDLPHPPHFPQNRERLDWRAAARHLAEMDVCVYAIQCASMDVARARSFYRELASFHRRSKYIALEQFYMMAELVLGIFHSASDDMEALRSHESELERTGRRTRNMTRAFATLRGDPEPEAADPDEEEMEPGAKRGRAGRSAAAGAAALGASLASGPLVPVAPGRFQTMPVPRDCSIRAFVESMGIAFKAGRGFYELSKPEDVSARKEVVLEERGTGDMFTGDQALRLLGVPTGGKARISPRAACCGQYKVYVQSTSYNRKLVAGTSFLYELDQA
jgi:hypothetical protein